MAKTKPAIRRSVPKSGRSKSQSNRPNLSIFMKIHSTENESILAIADANLLGKKYSDEKRVLDLQTFRSFYEGELSEAEKINSALEECTIANAVGKEAVSILIKKGLAKKSDIVDIGGISHVQICKIIKI